MGMGSVDDERRGFGLAFKTCEILSWAWAMLPSPALGRAEKPTFCRSCLLSVAFGSSQNEDLPDETRGVFTPHDIFGQVSSKTWSIVSMQKSKGASSLWLHKKLHQLLHDSK